MVVLAHLVATLPHAFAHQTIPVPTPPAETSFVAVVIVIAPLVAAALLWSRFVRFGAMLLLASMAGSLVFGLYYHFVLPGPDNVAQVPADGWGLLFQVSAVLLAVTEGLGCWTAGWMLSATRPTASYLQAVRTR
jgi:hypothetical protein